MRKPLTILSTMFLAASGLAACAASSPTETPTLEGSHLEVLAEGGIAALSITDRIDRDARGFVHVTRRLCDRNCQPPTDSASGVAPAATVDSLFNAALAQKNQLKDDYGITGQAADMMVYTVKITSNGSTKTVRADDGTMPAALRQIVAAVRATIAAARK